MTALPHVALTGKARAGKDTAGRHLVERFGYTRVAFADGVREVALAIDPFVPRAVGLPIRLSAVVEAHGWEAAKDSAEVRRLLQVIGTDAGRRHFGEDCWVKLALLKTLDVAGPIVYTDCRFPNEADAVRKAGGVVVRIERPGAGFDTAHGQHVSETALDDYAFDHRIVNDGPVEAMYRSLDFIVDLWRSQ